MIGRVERVVYGGLGLLRTSPEVAETRGTGAFVPFTLANELVELEPQGKGNQLVSVLEASPERVHPACPHFGLCGGCHLQMASYSEQLRIKHEVLRESLQRAGVLRVPAIATHAGEAWGYRNRIRLHVLRDAGALYLGYRERESKAVFAARTCPIAAPLLWQAAEAILSLGTSSADMHRWLTAAEEVELFCDDALQKAQITFIQKAKQSSLSQGSFARAMEALQAIVPEVAGAGFVQVHPRTGEHQHQIATWGAAGLSYRVGDESYWVSRGGFFQVNRFLLPTMVDLVCAGRRGALAWDLFAGVGLFARVLASNFERITAVEANPAAAGELASALRKEGPQHAACRSTTLPFLRRAALERDRPDLIVLDPPRAGAGPEACEFLVRIGSPVVVYVSCDPVTLARDLAVLQAGGYEISALHLVDLFPQTYHQEAVVVLHRRS